MVVMVENEQVTGSLNRQVGGGSLSAGGTGYGRTGGASRLTPNKLYADYLKREGGRPTTQETTSSTREQREADDFFRDF